MKAIVKLGLVGLTLAASAAHADVFLPDSGNGELTLFVRNDTTGAVYARGLQIRLDDILTQTQINAGYTGDTSLGIVQNLGYALGTVGPDANLSAFLNGTNSFSWTIMAGDSSGSNNPDPARRYLTTTQVVWDESNPNDRTNSNLISFSQLQTVQNLVNQNVAGDVAGDGASTAVNGQWRQVGAVPGQIAGNWFGAGPDTVNALGTAANLYVLTTNGGGASGIVRTYQGLDVVLRANGTLEAIIPPSTVPLPAAAWMLMSGLVTLAGVGRRKIAAATAA